MEQDKKEEEISAEAKLIASLVNTIGLSEEVAKQKHKAFLLKYPTGLVKKDDFLEIAPEIFGENFTLANYLFHIFDDDKDGKLDEEEYLLAINMSDSCSSEAKLSLIFNMLDTKNEGFIRKVDIRKVIVTLFHIGAIPVDPEIADGCLEDVMKSLTSNEKGNVSKAELLENGMKNDILKNMLM